MSTYRRPSEGAGEPFEIFQGLVQGCDEFSHLRDPVADVAFLMREGSLMLSGRMVLGQVHMPKVQGMLKDVFLWMLEELFGRVPDFLVTLDAEYWEAASGKEREILVYHEACHMGLKLNREGEPMEDPETGRPKFALVGHDVEEFSAVVRRYGAHSEDIRCFLAAASGYAGAERK